MDKKTCFALALILLSACAERGGTAPMPGSDAGPTALTDGSVAVDSAVLDLGAPATDAGTTTGCACPTLPATCALPTTGTPVFTPDRSGDYGAQLMSLLACADVSIDAAVYEIGWDCLVDAIETKLATDADLVIRLVIDDGRCPRDAAGVRMCPLARVEPHARVTIVDDSRSALMHHKFIVVDGAYAWLASTNLTWNSFCSDHNNGIVLDQPEIIAGLSAEFDRMFVSGNFSPVAPAPPITGGSYAMYFSPETPSSSPSTWFNDMIAAIDGATTSIDFMISSWTRAEVAVALIAAHDRGVVVHGLVGHLSTGGVPATMARAAGIDVRADNVHDKTIIIDGQLVITGSPNWSANAWNNNESSLWIRDAAIAATFTAEHGRLFTAAAP